jgi:hypothetical protein
MAKSPASLAYCKMFGQLYPLVSALAVRSIASALSTELYNEKVQNAVDVEVDVDDQYI